MVFEHRIYLIKDNSTYNITDLVSEYELNTSLNRLCKRFSFSIAYNDDYFFPDINIENGDILILQDQLNEIEMFKGMVVQKMQNGINELSFICYDFMYNLSNTKILVSSKKMTGSQVIRGVLEKNDIKIKDIKPLNTPYKKIAHYITLEGLIKDIILNENRFTGKEYRFGFEGDEFFLREKGSDLINPKFRLATNLDFGDCKEYIGNTTRSYDILDLKNKVKVVYQKDKKIFEVAEASDQQNINKYGEIMEVISVSKDDKAKAKQIAQSALKLLNKEISKASFICFGNPEIIAGKSFKVDDTKADIIGEFEITESTHTVKNGIWMTKVEMEELR